MKHILCILLAIVSLSSFGQSNTGQVVVYSETGEKFRVYLNGELMNEDPRANVLLTGLTSEIYQAKIDFLDAANADFSTDFLPSKWAWRSPTVSNGPKKVMRCVIFQRDR